MSVGNTIQIPYAYMISLRSALHREISDNIEYGEAALTMLRRKAECQLERIAPGHDEQVVEFWRSLLDIQVIQNRLSQERYRLSVLK